MRKLISMTDFVLEVEKTLFYAVTDQSIFGNAFAHRDYVEMYSKILNYANFLKQPLKLEMFVPCDDEGNVLEEPEFHEPNSESEIGDYDELRYNYEQSKIKVLFIGFRLVGFNEHQINTLNGTTFLQVDKYVVGQNKDLEKGFYLFYETIDEMLQESDYEIPLQLTESAIKQIGL